MEKAMSHQWFEDPAGYLVDIRPGPSERFARINDAYAQWVLGHGAPFNLTQTYRGPGSQPTDFDYAVVMRDLDAGRGRVVASGDPTEPADPGEPVRKGLFVGRLPLRSASIAPSVQAGTGADVADMVVPPEPEIDLAEKDQLVIVGVIDDAIQVAHERFRDAQGRSRVDAAWVQDADYPVDQGDNPGPGWPLWHQFGRVLRRAEISDAIATFGRDEDALMQALGLVSKPGGAYRPDLLRYLIGHGTHVADVAAGYPPSEDRRDRRLVTVQLPAYATEDTSGASLPAAVIAGGAFIFAQAAAMSRKAGVPIPVMLNFSYGLAGGLRDGMDVIERALREQADAYRAAMAAEFPTAPPAVNIVPAGNGNLSRSHARSAPAIEGTATLETRFRLQPDDRSASFIEFWVSKATRHVSVSVSTPLKLSHTVEITLPESPSDPGEVTLANDYVLAAAGGALDPATIVARLSVDCPACFPRDGGLPEDRAWRILLSLAPTAQLVPGQHTVPAGEWQMACVATGDTDGVIRAWLQRDTETLGFGIRGRQAYFIDNDYDAHLFDGYTDVAVADQVASDVTRNGTVSGIASVPDPVPAGAELISVGAMRWDIAGPSVYSAAGYAPQNTPDVLAAADTSRVLSGIQGATNRSGAVVAQGGTSNAAPVVTRFLANAAAAASAADYPGFSAHATIADKAEPPDRPNGEPELASNRKVRAERSELGTLEPPEALAADVARDTRRKWHAPTGPGA